MPTKVTSRCNHWGRSAAPSLMAGPSHVETLTPWAGPARDRPALVGSGENHESNELTTTEVVSTAGLPDWSWGTPTNAVPEQVSLPSETVNAIR